MKFLLVLAGVTLALPTELAPHAEVATREEILEGSQTLAQVSAQVVRVTVDQSRCPNLCSGRGKCVVNNDPFSPPENTTVCICDQGWAEYDCSRIVLPAHRLEDGVDCPNNCSSHGSCYRGSSVVLPRCYCDPHWTGADCSQLRPSFVFCENNCSGFGVCIFGYSEKYSSVMGKCMCDGNHAGDDCSIEKLSICPHDCSKHGTCTATGCVCEKNWRGTDCSLMDIPVCPNHCSSHGRCLNGKCICTQGFSGADCSLSSGPASCNHDCSGHGMCVYDTPYFPGGCRCFEGWFGPKCNQEKPQARFCPLNCSNNGFCKDDLTCSCFLGWSGSDCSFPNVVSGVNPNVEVMGAIVHPKLMDGPVVKPSKDDPTLLIESPENPTCKNNCSSHGVCLQVVDDKVPIFDIDRNIIGSTKVSAPVTLFVCRCDPGFGGEDCSVAPPATAGLQPTSASDLLKKPQPVTNPNVPKNLFSEDPTNWDKLPSMDQIRQNELGCPNNCSSRGRCIKNLDGVKVCSCYQGWASADCSEKASSKFSCPLECSGHGKCVTASEYFPVHCMCEHGWIGGNCEKPRPTKLVYEIQEGLCPNHCSSRGSCINGQCVCTEFGFGGPDCSVQAGGTCEKNCNGNGICFWGTCECLGGYSGATCDVEPSRPCPNQCNMRGKCVGGQCMCTTGFTGDDCSDIMIRCPNQCSGHGNCLEAVVSELQPAKCACSEGWTGSDCSNFPHGFQIPGEESHPTKAEQYFAEKAADQTASEVKPAVSVPESP